jgi:DHA2 family multidrug resistance protein-like MFS transporter
MTTTTARRPIRALQTPVSAGPREWLALAVIVMPVLLISIDNTVLTFALPQVSVALRPSGEQLMWLVDIYPLMLAGLLMAAGSLGDRVGRRRLLLIGAIGFGLASVGAAFSSSAEALIAWRVLLGVFGATLMPSTLSLIRTIFVNRSDRRIAVATWAATFSGGAALGPVVGGYLLEHLWWGSVFLVNVPIIVVFVGAAALLVPESRDPKPGRLDVLGIGWSMVAMLPFVYGIKQLAEHGLAVGPLGAMALGVLGAVMFVHRQATAAHPLIDLGLFSDRAFSGAIGANLLSMVGYAGFLFFAAQFLQLVVGLSPMAAATVLIPGLAVTIIAGFTVVPLARRVPVHVLVSVSFMMSAAGYAIAAFAGTPTLWSIMIAFVVLGLGIGFAETLTNDVMLSSVPRHQAGAASAASETAYEIGAVLGTAVLGSVLTASYRAHLTIPAVAHFGEQDGAFETLGGTVEHARSFPNILGEELLLSAHAAFENAVQLTSGVAIVVALGAAWVSWRTLRGTSLD